MKIAPFFYLERYFSHLSLRRLGAPASGRLESPATFPFSYTYYSEIEVAGYLGRPGRPALPVREFQREGSGLIPPAGGQRFKMFDNWISIGYSYGSLGGRHGRFGVGPGNPIKTDGRF